MAAEMPRCPVPVKPLPRFFFEAVLLLLRAKLLECQCPPVLARSLARRLWSAGACGGGRERGSAVL